MCGIHAAIVDSASGEPPPLSQLLRQSLSSRGPDHIGQTRRDIPVGQGTRILHLIFTSTVLALRGDHVAAQPLEDIETGSVLCWNGEAWRLGDEAVDGNDGEVILARLRTPEPSTTVARETYVLDILRSIEGPFAFLYYDAGAKCLYFGRDRLGRRSLLCSHSEDFRSIAFSSIADEPSSDWKEVQADGVYSIPLKNLAATVESYNPNTYFSKHDWVPSTEFDLVSRPRGLSFFVLGAHSTFAISLLPQVSSIGIFNTTIPESNHILDFDTPSVSRLRYWLSESLKLRVLGVPEPPDPPSDVDTRIAVLFSVGLIALSLCD